MSTKYIFMYNLSNQLYAASSEYLKKYGKSIVNNARGKGVRVQQLNNHVRGQIHSQLGIINNWMRAMKDGWA